MRGTIVLVVWSVLYVLLLGGMEEDQLQCAAESNASQGVACSISRCSVGSIDHPSSGSMSEEQDKSSNVADMQLLEAVDEAGMQEEHISAFTVVRPSLWLRRRGGVDVACPQLFPAEVIAGLDALSKHLQRVRM